MIFQQLFHIFVLLLKMCLLALIPVVLVLGFLVDHVSSKFDGNAELPVDCAIVFGAAVHRQTLSGPGIERRVQTAANLYKNQQVQTLFMTGGKGDDLHDSEAEVMKRTAMEYGVQAKDIILEESATSTWDNLALTRPLVLAHGCTSVLAISDAYHLARIQYLATQQEWGNLRTLPADTRPPKAFELRATVREAFGLVYYFFNQYIPMEKFLEPVSFSPVL